MRGPIKRGAAAVGNANIKIIMLKNVVIINDMLPDLNYFRSSLFSAQAYLYQCREQGPATKLENRSSYRRDLPLLSLKSNQVAV